jgi:hypothetical protein
VKITGNSVEPIKGFKQFGNRLETSGRIRDAYTFIKKDGTEIPVRIRDNGVKNFLEWYDSVNDTWYVLLEVMTSGLNTVFQDYNTSTVNQLFFGNGTNNYTKWSGAVTRLTQAVNLHDTEIHVADNSDFPASGTIIYNGTSYSNTSKTGTTIFNVADAHASAGADDGVAEYPDYSTYSAVAKSDVMISAQNRMWLVNNDTSLEYSKEGDATDWTAGSNRADAGIEDFPIVGGKIKGLAALGEFIFIFKERTVIQFNWQYPTSTTKTPVFQHLAVGDNLGSINHKGISNIYNEILYTSKTGVKSLSKEIQSGNWRDDPITDDIRPNIEDYDFSQASAFYDDKEDVYLVACKSDSDAHANDRVIAIWFYKTSGGQRTYGISILDLTADCFFKYNNKLYFGSSMEANCYELFTGNTKNGASFSSYYTCNRNDFGEKSIKSAELYIVEGFIKAGTALELKIFFDGGKNGSQTVEIASTDDCVSQAVLNTLGSYPLGEQMIGRLFNDAGDLRPFRKIIELQQTNFIDLQVERKCTSKGGYYQIYYEGLVNPKIIYNLTSN